MPTAIATHVDIAAPPATVWAVLTDLPRHAEWNPFIRSISGELRPGSRLAVHVAPPGKPGMRFRPTVLVATPERELRWIGRVGLRGVFDGEHWFRLEPTGPAACRFHHGETFSGLLVPLFGKGLPETTAEGFRRMNEALKVRAEAMESSAA